MSLLFVFFDLTNTLDVEPSAPAEAGQANAPLKFYTLPLLQGKLRSLNEPTNNSIPPFKPFKPFRQFQGEAFSSGQDSLEFRYPAQPWHVLCYCYSICAK